MIKKILFSIIIFQFLLSCSDENVTYSPKIVYFKNPSLIDNKIKLEFAVSDILIRSGKIDISILSGNNEELFKTTVEDGWFDSNGTVFTSEAQVSTLPQFPFKVVLKACVEKDLCDEKNIEISSFENGLISEKVKISGKIETNLTNSVDVILKKSNKKISTKDVFSFENIDAGYETILIRGESNNSKHFVREIELKDLYFNSDSNIIFYTVEDKNEYYDEPLVDCNFSLKGNPAVFLLSITLLAFLFFIKRTNKD